MAKIQKRLLEKKEGKYTERKKIDLKNTDMFILGQRVHLVMVI